MGNSVDSSIVVTFARGWVGVPWHHQGRSAAGVDCAGLIECVLRQAGALPESYNAPKNYSRLPLGDHLMDTVERWCTRVDKPLPGTAVTIRWPQMSGSSHIAICTGPTLIHAYRKSSGVVEQSYRQPWLRLTTGTWRLPGVTYE